MSAATWLVGDVFERLAEIPDGSVDLVLTSPPFTGVLLAAAVVVIVGTSRWMEAL